MKMKLEMEGFVKKSNSNLEREAHEIVGGIGLHLLDLL